MSACFDLLRKLIFSLNLILTTNELFGFIVIFFGGEGVLGLARGLKLNFSVT